MDMTIEQAMKVAADLEKRGCLNEPAKAARVLLAHINSLASPQVTDEQMRRGIEAAAKWVDDRREAFDNEFGMTDPATGTFEFKRDAQHEYSSELHEVAEGIRALSAPPAAETPQECLVRNLSIPKMPCDTPLNYARFLAAVLWRDYYRDVSPDFMLLPDAIGMLSQIDNMLTGIKRKAANQDAKQCVSAVNTSAERVQDSAKSEQEAKPVAADAQKENLYREFVAHHIELAIRMDFEAMLHTLLREKYMDQYGDPKNAEIEASNKIHYALEAAKVRAKNELAHVNRENVSLFSYLAAAPQEQAPAEKPLPTDGEIRQAVEYIVEQEGFDVTDSKYDLLVKEVAISVVRYFHQQSQPQQVTKGGDE